MEFIDCSLAKTLGLLSNHHPVMDTKQPTLARLKHVCGLLAPFFLYSGQFTSLVIGSSGKSLQESKTQPSPSTSLPFLILFSILHNTSPGPSETLYLGP